jgi:hypothetical protein
VEMWQKNCCLRLKNDTKISSFRHYCVIFAPRVAPSQRCARKMSENALLRSVINNRRFFFTY